MNASESKVLLTGAAGGIGRSIALELLGKGAEVLLVDRDARALEAVAQALAIPRERFELHAADLTSAPEREELCRKAAGWHGGINVLVNNAGVNPFGMFEALSPQQLDVTLAINLQAPMHLCRELLPHLRRQDRASIVNTGSVFGAIGYPGYAAYSASKFALRGFTEALRRELSGSRVTVQYFAPRATRTPINPQAVENMNRELGVAMDPPERVARELVALLESRRSSAVVGWPEKLFVRLNALMPGLVDRALRRQLPVIRRYADGQRSRRSEPAAPAETPTQIRNHAL